MKYFAIFALLFLFFSTNVLADYTTGMATGVVIGSAMSAASNGDHNTMISGDPVKIISLNCWSGSCAKKRIPEIDCPENTIKQVLWKDDIAESLILCIKPQQEIRK
jgi:hypothetical protein